MNRREPEHSPYAEIDMRVVTVDDDNASIAIVEVIGADGNVLRYTGSSKRVPGDRYDATVGRTFAISRALTNAGQALNQAAGDLVAEIYGD
jgi:hypothetical protein